MHFFKAAFFKALILAVLLSSFTVDDVQGVTIIVRPSYRRIRIQGPSPSTTTTTTTTTSTTTTTAAAETTTASEESTEETTLTSKEEQDENENLMLSIPVKDDDEDSSPTSPPASPEVTTSGERVQEEPTEEIDSNSSEVSESNQQASTIAPVEEELVATTLASLSPSAEREVDQIDTQAFPTERFSRLLADDSTTTSSAEIEPALVEEDAKALSAEIAADSNELKETSSVAPPRRNDDSSTPEVIADEEIVTEEATTIPPSQFVVEDFMNELVGPGREAKAINDDTADFAAGNSVDAATMNKDMEEDNEDDSKDGGGMFAGADPFLSVMGAMLSSSTTPASDPATQATTFATSSILKALFPESSVDSSTENALEQEGFSEPSRRAEAEREKSLESTDEGDPKATSIESEATATSTTKAPELPAIFNRPGAFLSESTLKNLEVLLEQDRKFREEQEQALSFLKSIKTPLALADVVEVDSGVGSQLSSTAFPPIDTGLDGGDASEEEEDPSVLVEEEHDIGGQRHQTGFFGGFRQFPPNLQTSGLSLPSQHQIGRPLFAARPFPGPLPPTLSGFPGATLLQPPEVPVRLSRPSPGGDEEEEAVSRVVDPFLAASSPPLSVSRQRSAANKRSPPPPILVFDRPRGNPPTASVLSPSVATLLPSASQSNVKFINRPVSSRVSRPAVASAFRTAPTSMRRPTTRSRVPSATASASSAGLSDTILAASASGGNPFLVRLPSDRGRAGRQVVLQSHPDTEFVYTV